MRKTLLLVLFIPIGLSLRAQNQSNYKYYHQQVVEIETLIANEKFAPALSTYEDLFEQYDFVFRRDYQIASQLAWHQENEKKASDLITKGIKAGWTLKGIKKNDFLEDFRKTTSWKNLRKQYKNLHQIYQESLDQDLQNEVKKMFSKDQWKALGALFVFNEKGYRRYAEKKFAPHSIKQVQQLQKILNASTYPGERLIGNNFWASTILSHHNSTTPEIVKADTLYLSIKPQLDLALEDLDRAAGTEPCMVTVGGQGAPAQYLFEP
ncbi:MAG: hypothetical protein AAF242_10105, partial [Bacteroidota bacterium]